MASSTAQASADAYHNQLVDTLNADLEDVHSTFPARFILTFPHLTDDDYTKNAFGGAKILTTNNLAKM
jgi:hypothetical protein